MSERVKKPRLWSDFDGTAVKKYPKRNPRNWLKYPLPGLARYIDFIQGVQSTDVEFAGVATIRKRFLRERVTNRSLRKLGYIGTIKPEMVKYAGNERKKAKVVVDASQETAVGMIDDKPHKIGKAILKQLVKIKRDAQAPDQERVIVLGAVAHGRSQEHLDELAANAAEEFGGQVEVRRPDYGPNLQLAGDGFRLDVVQLADYSTEAGQEFGELLQAAA